MSVVMPNWLNAATATGATAALEVTGATSFGLQVSTTGSPSDVQVHLEASINGTNWTSIATVQTPGGGMDFVTGRATRYIRANLTFLVGGSSPTVTASVVAA